MRIGDLAAAAGTSGETIRYYERIGLLRRPARTDGNYRDYGPADVRRLRFIRHARGLGFDLTDIRSFLALADAPDAECRAADEAAGRHLRSVEEKIDRLQRLRAELERMIGQCRTGQAADCRILEVLADHSLCQSDHGEG
jgi:DNA-binding transcriptional MerR regulator